MTSDNFEPGTLLSAMSSSRSALQLFSVGVQVESHNIANISSCNFLPQKEYAASGPKGRGVELQAVLRDAPNHGVPIAIGKKRQNTAILGRNCRPSGTELDKELPRMMSGQRGFEANCVAMGIIEDMLGVLLNMQA